MRSTGMEALDSRLGGIEEGGLFLVLGPDGVGKSVLGLHFIAAGLERHEPCLLVSSAAASEIDGRGLFIGLNRGGLTEHPDLTIVDIAAETAQGMGGARHAPVEALRKHLDGGNGGRRYARVVVDDLNTFLEHSHTPAATALAAAELLRSTGGSSYVTVTSSDLEIPSAEVMSTVARTASAVLELQRTGRGRRRFVFREVRQRSFSTDPFMYTLRSGGGFSEDLPAYDRAVQEELRRRIVVLDEVGVVGEAVHQALSSSFEIESFHDLDRSLTELLAARYGVLIIGVDPYDPERAFNLTYTLRKAGNGAPILFISPSRGLRSTTRSRGLRIGGDDFLLAELPPSEIVERIRVTAHRGHHRRNGSVRPDRQLQPQDERGDPRPMEPEELRRSLLNLIGEAPTPFFALAILFPEAGSGPERLWATIRQQLRLEDGDLVSVLPDGRVALVINQVDGRLARRVLSRMRRAAPFLAGGREPTLYTSPLQETQVRRWIGSL